MKPEDKSLDILGLKPVGDAINTVTKGGVDGVGAFLSKICLPAAEEFGLLLRDKVKAWRAINLENTVQEAEHRVGNRIAKGVNAHPRVVHEILDKASWTDDKDIQRMWAGLLASSCTEGGNDDGNLIFINVLAQLTSAQVRIINFACENAPKFQSKSGLPYANEMTLDSAALFKISRINDIQRLDRELDCLRVLELIGAGGFGGLGGGLDTHRDIVKICPSGVALHLFVKAQGFLGSPVEYWNLTLEKPPVEIKPEGK